MTYLRAASLIALASLSACATIVSGSSQRVTVDTSPEGASCLVSQGGLSVGQVRQTPGAVVVARGNGMIQVNCAKPGYAPVQQADGTTINGWVFGNIVFGGLVGVVIDLATGAAYHYGPNMMVTLDGRAGAGQRMAILPDTYRYGYAPGLPGAADGIQPDLAASVPSDQQRFYAATGRSLPSQHGIVVLPPATPNGDYTYIWPKSQQN